jgi:AcrR family transcriptional regulator
MTIMTDWSVKTLGEGGLMPESIGKGIKLDRKKRRDLLHLLSEPRPLDAAEWDAFWQPLLGQEVGVAGGGAEVLSAVFDEGLTLLSARGLSEGSPVSRWIKVVVRAAAQHGVDREVLLEGLLRQQVSRQVGHRDHTRAQIPQTRDKILTAALEVFSSRGFHGATVDEVAERGGLGKGTVYRHFSSKRELFSELIRSKVAELEEAVTGAIDPRADVLETIETYLRIYFGFFDRNRNLYKVLIQEQSDFGAEVKALYIGNILKKLPLLKRKILHAGKNGHLKPINFHTVFYGVMGFVDGVIQKWLASDGRYSLMDEMPTVLEAIFYGFVNRAPSERG